MWKELSTSEHNDEELEELDEVELESEASLACELLPGVSFS